MCLIFKCFRKLANRKMLYDLLKALLLAQIIQDYTKHLSEEDSKKFEAGRMLRESKEDDVPASRLSSSSERFAPICAGKS